MRITVTQEAIIFLQSVVLGFFIGALYDIIKAVRVECKLGGKITIIFDISFCLVAMMMTVLFVVAFAQSSFRIYIVVAQCLGGFLYFVTLSILLVRVEKSVIRIVYKLIISPILLISEKTMKIFAKIIKKVYNIAFLCLKNKYVIVYNRIRSKKILEVKPENKTDV